MMNENVIFIDVSVKTKNNRNCKLSSMIQHLG